MGNTNKINESKKNIDQSIKGDDFFKSALAKSEIIESHKNNNFLGEYEKEFFNIKLIKKDLIYNLYKAENIKEQRDVTLKVYDKKKLEKGDYDYFLEQVKREEEIIKLCKCENIVNIYRKLETNNYIIFEMESWDINLSDYIKTHGCFNNRFNTFKEIILGIANALKVLNEKGVMHRDIEPRNLFLKNLWLN